MMIDKMRKMEIGTLKLMVERVMSYIGMLNFVMVLYLYAIQSPLGIDWIYWVLMMSVVLPIVMILDWVFVYPSVLTVSYGRKNKEFQDLREDIRGMQKKMDAQNKMLESLMERK